MITSPNGTKCYLVALEGADRVGKATQGTLLEEALWKRKKKATVEAIPYNDGVTYQKIYDMLHEGTALQHPTIFQTLQGINRFYFQKKVLPNLASHHDVLILDRWALSTRVYGGCTGVSDEETDTILEGVIPPDVTFVFDGDPFPKEGLDSYEKDLELQTNVRASYLSYCKEWPNEFVRIDTKNRTPLEIHGEVLQEVLRRLD